MNNTDDSFLPKMYYKLQECVHKLVRKYNSYHTYKHHQQPELEHGYYYRVLLQS